LATGALLVDVFDVGNSPLADDQFISNCFACTGPVMSHHTMQADEELLVFLEGASYHYYFYSSDAC